MGDIASLIAPRPLWVQSCRDDRLNGPRGVVNVEEQVAIAHSAIACWVRRTASFTRYAPAPISGTRST